MGWKTAFVAAAVRQGPSFVVLLLILFAAWDFGTYAVHQGIPAYLEQIKTGYREIQASHDANLERLVVTFEQQQDRVQTVMRLLEGLVENKDLIRQNNQLLLQIIRDLQHAIRPVRPDHQRPETARNAVPAG
jgi:hypothetical protein